MIEAARQRLSRWTNVIYAVKTFQQMLQGDLPWASMDFVASSFAIQHVATGEKPLLFHRIRTMLVPGGHFLNMDIVRPGSPRHETWYDEMWKEWILAKQRLLAPGQDFSTVPEDARKKPENRYETLEDQLVWLREAGFIEVECHYRRGLFGVYSGQRPLA